MKAEEIMMVLEERPEQIPLCPHCEKRLTTVFFRELKGMFGKRYVYFCSMCEKVLGVSHRKGYWMG